MEGDEVLASMDSLWFFSSVFATGPPSKRSQARESRGEAPQPDSAETSKTMMPSGSSTQAAEECVVKAAAAAAAAGRRAAAAKGSREEWEERVEAWRKEQRRRTLVVVAAPARCSPAPMPPHDDGTAMKAHLRSWAHAVACSVR